MDEELVFHSPLSKTQLLATSDFGTDEMVLNQELTPAIAAKYARTVVDLNRAPDCADGSIIQGMPQSQDRYLKAGYGVIPKFASRGFLIRDGKLSVDQARSLMSRYYYPYHMELKSLIGEVKGRFGEVILLDIHTAPALAMGHTEIVLGTLFGHSVSSVYCEQIEAIFGDQFDNVERDVPYSGGYITQHYSRKKEGYHVVQIEVNRALVESPKRELRQDFIKKWRVVVGNIVEAFRRDESHRMAAE